MVQQEPINESEFLLFKDYVCDRCGIFIPPEKAYLIETRLAKLMIDAGAASFGDFYDILAASPDSPLHQKVINAITTNETLWFRDSSPWRLLEESFLPGLVDDIRSGRKVRVRIWCAAVSTGQEIYSTAMFIDDYLSKHKVSGVNLSNFDFFATDISSRVLDIAKKGRYDKISMTRGLNDYYREKYFTVDGSAWDIEPRIRNAVRFEKFNLQREYNAFGVFDIIFCRYVLIYFNDELKRKIVKKMNNALNDNGVLFTGNYVLSELFKDDFDANHYENITYYTKKAVTT